MECKCTFTQKTVGDGCEVCNPAKALEYAKETIAELEAEVERYQKTIEEAAQMAESYDAHPYSETVGEVVRILRAEPPEQQ